MRARTLTITAARDKLHTLLEPNVDKNRSVAQVIVAVWVGVVVLAGALSALSETAGRMEGPAVGIAMGGGITLAFATAWSAWTLLAELPVLVRRLAAIAGMAGALWGVGTLTRAAYFLLA